MAQYLEPIVHKMGDFQLLANDSFVAMAAAEMNMFPRYAGASLKTQKTQPEREIDASQNIHLRYDVNILELSRIHDLPQAIQ